MITFLLRLLYYVKLFDMLLLLFHMHFLYYYTSEPDFTCKTTFPILFVFKEFLWVRKKLLFWMETVFTREGFQTSV